MAHLRRTEHFEAPIDQVFDVLIDARRWPEWMSGGMEIKEITGPVDQAGTRIHEASKFLGRTVDSWDEIVEVERPRLLKMTGSGAGMKYTGTFRLTPAGQGTDAVLESEYEVPLGFLGHAADRLFLEKSMEREMRHNAENFKALVEAKVAVPA